MCALVTGVQTCALPISRRFGNLLPDRQQHIDDVRRGDSSGRNIAQFRKSVSLEAGKPLPRIDGACPSRRIFHMILAVPLPASPLRGRFRLFFRQSIVTLPFITLPTFFQPMYNPPYATPFLLPPD